VAIGININPANILSAKAKIIWRKAEEMSGVSMA
jgi:hypothetical protein